jgi:hypothetical protein
MVGNERPNVYAYHERFVAFCFCRTCLDFLDAADGEDSLMLSTHVGQLPRHQYVWVDSDFTHEKPIGFVPAVWFGLVSYPGRAWGCTVMLECGAIYRALPPHALAFSDSPEIYWPVQMAQRWDCYGWNFTAHIYDYLDGLDCRVRIELDCPVRIERYTELDGQYLFSVAPVGDAFSAYPEQAKEFTFVRLDNDRLTVQPTNNLLFTEKSFTRDVGWPTDLQRQSKVYHAE